MSKSAKIAILVVFFSVLCAVGCASIWALTSGPEAGPVTVAGQKVDPSPVGVSEPPRAAEPTPPPVEGGTAARIRAAGVLRVAMDTGEPPWTGTPPMYSKDASGKDSGFDMELAQMLANALGVGKVEIVHGRYSELPALLADPAGKVDVLISGYSPADEAGISWSDSYLDYGLCLVVPAKSKVKTTKDLFGEAVGIFDDEAAAEAVNGLVKGYTELVRLEDGYWDQLLSGRFAGFIYDYPYAVAEISRFYAQNPHRKGAFRIAQYNLTDSSYAVGLRSADADLLPTVNTAIQLWRAEASYADAVKRWLSSGLPADAPTDSGKKTVKVAAGDTLSRIAARELGSAEKWTAIWAVNRDRFPNPHLIEVGDVVVLP